MHVCTYKWSAFRRGNLAVISLLLLLLFSNIVTLLLGRRRWRGKTNINMRRFIVDKFDISRWVVWVVKVVQVV